MKFTSMPDIYTTALIKSLKRCQTIKVIGDKKKNIYEKFWDEDPVTNTYI